MESNLSARLRTAALVCTLVASSIFDAAAAVIGVSEVPLNGQSGDVRRFETNLRNLVADSFGWRARRSGFTPEIAFINGAGIRRNTILFPDANPHAPAEIDYALVLSLLLFGNKVVVVEEVTVPRLLSILEHSVAQLNDTLSTWNQFLQVSGLRMSWARARSRGAASST